MSFEKASAHLKKYDLDKNIVVFDEKSATVKMAAECLNCHESDIAKTLSFIVGDKVILIVMAGNAKIDNAKYKSVFHLKAKMVEYNEVETLVGHAVGGVCPFGINDGVDVYLDVSLKTHEFLYPAVGSDNSAVRLSLSELELSSKYKEYIDVCKVNDEN